jgi:hypothetical protein
MSKRGCNGQDFHARVDAGLCNGIAFSLPGASGAAGDQTALRLEQLRLIELIRAQGVAPSPRAKGFEPLAAAG